MPRIFQVDGAEGRIWSNDRGNRLGDVEIVEGTVRSATLKKMKQALLNNREKAWDAWKKIP